MAEKSRNVLPFVKPEANSAVAKVRKTPNDSEQLGLTSASICAKQPSQRKAGLTLEVSVKVKRPE